MCIGNVQVILKSTINDPSPTHSPSGATGSNFGFLNMRILYQFIGFVNTKILEDSPKLTTQSIQLKSATPCFIFYLWRDLRTSCCSRPIHRAFRGMIRIHNHRRRGILPRISTEASNYKTSVLNCVSLIWAIILLAIVSANFADAQRTSTSVSDTLSSKADERFARALEPMTFQFPRDHGAHPEYQIEWWYYTGNLHTNDGEAFGYQLTFFRFGLTPEMPERTSHFATNQVYMGHFAITDAANNEYFCFERRSRGAGGLAGAAGDPTYKVWLEDWSATEVEPGVMRLHVPSTSDSIEMEPQIGLSLDLRQTRPAILQGDRGLSQKGPEPGNATYYYSLVGLETTGEVTINGKTAAVSGISWMDHEFGTSFLPEGFVGWDWFSLQLDNDLTLMLYCLRRSDQSCDPQTLEGTLIHPRWWAAADRGERFHIDLYPSVDKPRKRCHLSLRLANNLSRTKHRPSSRSPDPEPGVSCEFHLLGGCRAGARTDRRGSSQRSRLRRIDRL